MEGLNGYVSDLVRELSKFDSWPPRTAAQLTLFNTIEPILQLLAIFKLLLVTPMPRFLYEGCCPLESHAFNRFEGGFEDKLRVGLRDYRINMKNFAFMRNMRNIKVLDPSDRQDQKEEWRGYPASSQESQG
jgi:hypothetical protein